MLAPALALPDPPEHCLSRYVVRVRFCETDLMGIVHHASYLSYFEAGRVEYMHRRGVDYLSWTERGVHLPVINAQIGYKRTARFDDLLIVETRLARLRRVRMRFDYRMYCPADGTPGELVADGSTELACVGDDHRPRALPADVIELLLSPETHPRPIDQV